MAVLCLWAALFHTPMGALVRSGVAKVFGIRSSARPMLAYFSGGAAPHRGDGALVVPKLPVLPRDTEVTQAFALGLGLHASLKQLPAHRHQAAHELATTLGVDATKLLDQKRGAQASAALIARASEKLGSDEAAVLAAFAGWEPARYASERSRAEGVEVPTLEQLTLHLPPGFDDAIGAAQDALAFGTAYGLGWPVPERTPISSGFGVRVHPVLGTTKLHTGVDLPLPIGSPVRVTADGVIRRASEDGVNGRVLIVEHARGVTTAYCHNDALLVKIGEVVRRGQVVARSGNTGRSTGPHLHYQLELSNQPVDPLAFHARGAVTEKVPLRAQGGD